VTRVVAVVSLLVLGFAIGWCVGGYEVVMLCREAQARFASEVLQALESCR
jgi:hypothetical protein